MTDYRIVNISDNVGVEPTRLEFTTEDDGEITLTEVPANSPLVVTPSNNNSHVKAETSSTIALPLPSSSSQPASRRHQHHKLGFLSCFRKTDDSPS